MPVVALACFVVVAKNGFPSDDKCKAILEPMFGFTNRLRQPPDDQLDESVFGDDVGFIEQHHSIHVGEYANSAVLLSKNPTTGTSQRVG